MSAPEVLKIQDHHIPRVVNSVCTTIVMLAVIYTSYSYLLTQLENAQKPLLQQIDMLQLQLKDEKDKRLGVEQESARLKMQIDEKDKQLKKLVSENGDQTVNFEGEKYAQVCPLTPQVIDNNLIRRALQATLSRKSTERFEGFSVLMNNLDYLDDQMQRNIVELYLNEVDKRNRDGVYYALFILSQLRPTILKEYQTEIEGGYSFIYEGSGWDKTLYKYCQLESKFNKRPE